MTRISLPLGRRLFLLVAILAALVLTLPARLVLGGLRLADAGLTARAAEGSVWSGRLVETRIGGLPLGDLRTGLRPLPLLTGRARLALAGGTSDGDGDAVRGAITVSRHVLGIDDTTLHLPVARLFAPLPIREVGLSAVGVRFRDGICETAGGTVRADLVGEFAGTPLPGSFTGTARCDAGALLLPLASANGERLTLRLLAGGRYRAEIALRPADPAAAARLAATGFTPAPDGGVSLGVDGRW